MKDKRNRYEVKKEVKVNRYEMKGKGDRYEVKGAVSHMSKDSKLDILDNFQTIHNSLVMIGICKCLHVPVFWHLQQRHYVATSERC